MSKNTRNKHLSDKEKQAQEDLEMNPSMYNDNLSLQQEARRFNVFSSQSNNNVSGASGTVNFNSSLLFSNSNNNIQNQNQQMINIPRSMSMNFPINAAYNNINISNPSNSGYCIPSKVKDEKIILKTNFEKLLNEKLNKYGLSLKQNNFNDIINTLNNGLDIYLKNVLERLIVISRARNVNLNLYSKLSEKNPVKIKLI